MERFVVHYCKNKKCNNVWIDKDVTNANLLPPSWKYCDECCKKYGFVNPPKPKRSNLQTEQLLNARSKIGKTHQKQTKTCA